MAAIAPGPNVGTLLDRPVDTLTAYADRVLYGTDRLLPAFGSSANLPRIWNPSSAAGLMRPGLCSDPALTKQGLDFSLTTN